MLRPPAVSMLSEAYARTVHAPAPRQEKAASGERKEAGTPRRTPTAGPGGVVGYAVWVTGEVTP
ncbi:hypothetical protein GCM10010433_51730 [Streptomyces pulveraceus]